jgi:hypothetical protein
MGAPLSFNFIGEFLSLYGIFERLPVIGAFACSSIVLSAAFTIFMFNRIVFGGSYSPYLSMLSDLNRREFFMLFFLVAFTILLGVYPAPILDGLHYSVSTLIYSSNFDNFTMAFIPICIITTKKYLKINSRSEGVKFKQLSNRMRFKSFSSIVLQQLQIKLDPFFVSGFIDAEGAFIVSIVKDLEFTDFPLIDIDGRIF